MKLPVIQNAFKYFGGNVYFEKENVLNLQNVNFIIILGMIHQIYIYIYIFNL
jgi:hypothetical protein